jgi:hypothetical protein
MNETGEPKVNKQLHEQLEQATARIEALIHIGGMLTDPDSLPNAIERLLEEDDDTLSHAFPDIPDWVKEALDDLAERGYAFFEWAHQNNKLGFVVQFATPVMRDVDGDGGGTFSWGHYCTRWVYGETLEEAAKRGLEWVAERRAAELEKERGKAGAQ